MLVKVKSLKQRTRITDYCEIHFPILGSRSAVKKAIAKGLVFLNNRRAKDTDLLNNGDVIKLKRPGKQKVKKIDLATPIPIIYEDEYIIVANKPAGIAVNGNRNKTLENAVASIFQASEQADALLQPVAAHRIDVPTKGLVILAKTKKALINLNKAFQNHQIKKAYIAIVHGQTPEKGRIEVPIQGKDAITEYERLAVVPSKIFQHLSLLRLSLITGRTHQLRIHLSTQSHLIVGDKEYAKGRRTILGKGLFLCSCELAFTHPCLGTPVHLKIDPPVRFKRLMEREGGRFSKTRSTSNSTSTSKPNFKSRRY